MLHRFTVTKAQLRDLALHKVGNDIIRENENPPQPEAAYEFPPLPGVTQDGEGDDNNDWEIVSERCKSFAELVHSVDIRERLRRARAVMSSLRATCRKDVRKYAASKYVFNETRIAAKLALAEKADRMTLSYLALVMEDQYWWNCDHRREWMGSSGMEMQQRRDNKKAETLRNDHVNDAPSKGLDVRGQHQASSYSRKVRWAYCAFCTEAVGYRQLFKSYAKLGNAKCKTCGSKETVVDNPATAPQPPRGEILVTDTVLRNGERQELTTLYRQVEKTNPLGKTWRFGWCLERTWLRSATGHLLREDIRGMQVSTEMAQALQRAWYEMQQAAKARR